MQQSFDKKKLTGAALRFAVISPFARINTVQQVHGLSFSEAKKKIAESKSSCCCCFSKSSCCGKGEEQKPQQDAAASSGEAKKDCSGCCSGCSKFYRGQGVSAVRHAVISVLANLSQASTLYTNYPVAKILLPIFVTNPIDVVQIKLSADVDGQYDCPIDALKKTVQEEGPLALVKGAICTTAEAFLLKYLYGVIHGKLKVDGAKGFESMARSFAAFAAAHVAIYPIDTIKKVVIAKKVWPVGAVKEIKEKNGILGFYKGLETKILSMVLSTLVFVAVDKIFAK